MDCKRKDGQGSSHGLHEALSEFCREELRKLRETTVSVGFLCKEEILAWARWLFSQCLTYIGYVVLNGTTMFFR
jgi:hypothetical protein